MKNKTKLKIKDLTKKLKQRFTEKNIIRQQRATLEIPEIKQEPYRSIYFKKTYEQEKRKLFWK